MLDFDASETRHDCSGIGARINGPNLSLIRGGRFLTDEERIKARIKGILKEADDKNVDTYASLLISTFKKQSRSKWTAILLAVVGTVVATTAILWLAGLLIWP